MRIFLIANNRNISKDWVNNMNKNIKIQDDDYIVRFNCGKLLNLFNGKTTHFLFRGDKVGFQGINNDYKIENRHISKIKNNINFGVIVYTDEKKNSRIVKDIQRVEKRNNIKIKTIIPMGQSIKNLTGKSPSSGFITLLHYLKNFPKAEIYLMGFTFYNGVNNWHNFSGEINFVRGLIDKINRIKIFF